MALPKPDCRGTLGLENDKFRETTEGDIVVAVVNEGPASPPAGLSGTGLVTLVTLNSATWTPLPATALTNRNSIGLQNETAIQLKLNFSTPAGYVGWSVNPNGEIFVDIKDNVILYAKAQSGTPTITVLELA